MNTWKVIGADRDTGSDVEIELAADDEPSAMLAALERGIYVSDVRLAAPPASAVCERPTASGPRPGAAAPGVGKNPDTPHADALHAPAPHKPPHHSAPRQPTPHAPLSHAPVARAPVAQAPVSRAPAPVEPPTKTVPQAALMKAHPTRRVQVRRAPGEPLPRAFAELLSVPQPPPRPNRAAPACTNPRRGATPRPVVWPEGEPAAPAPIPPLPKSPPHARRRGWLTGPRGLCLGAAAGAAAVALVLLPPGSSPVGGASADDRPAGMDVALMGLVADDPSAGTDDPARAAAGGDVTPYVIAAAAPRVREGPIEVVLLSAAVQRFEPGGGPPRLVLAVRLRNASSSATLRYHPWSAAPVDGDAPSFAAPPRLLDDAGRVYPAVGVGFGRDSARPATSLAPGEAVTDVLAFDQPTGPFAHLDLELPPANVGGKSGFPLRLRVPASTVWR